MRTQCETTGMTFPATLLEAVLLQGGEGQGTTDLMRSDVSLQVVGEMSKTERSALMKFATSVSRAPLGGFKHLNPPLTIHKAGPPLPAQKELDSPERRGESSRDCTCR